MHCTVIPVRPTVIPCTLCTGILCTAHYHPLYSVHCYPLHDALLSLYSALLIFVLRTVIPCTARTVSVILCTAHCYPLYNACTVILCMSHCHPLHPADCYPLQLQTTFSKRVDTRQHRLISRDRPTKTGRLCLCSPFFYVAALNMRI